jgi:hypothetical protein
MERQIKLIWDFRGPEALHIAKHHEIHLKDFIKAEKITDRDLTGYEEVNDLHAIAYWIIIESEIKKYRDVLKPNRATVYEK